MHTLWRDIFAFLSGYVSYWQSYATGGVVTGLIGLGERLAEKTLPRRAYVAIFVVTFSVVAFFMTWRDQYIRGDRLEQTIGSLNTTKQQVDSLNQKLVLEAAGKDATISTLQSQIGGQQGTINSALLQLGKNQSEQLQPLRITSHEIRNMLPQAPRSGFRFAITYLVMTNKTLTPIRLLVTCEADIEASGEVLGANAVTSGGWGGRVTRRNNQYGIGILSPAWSQSNPMIVTVYSNTQRFGLCSFDQQ